jgi:NAD(P)-dependent dehydrogenase (short-subunit alcohol dehydrogenase family)
MKTFENKVVIVTGGTSGIGRATALAFAAEGAHVVVAGRREAEGAESLELIERAGGKGLFVKTDVSREDEIEALVARTVEHFGRLDIAFNNAGVLLDRGPITDVTDETIDRTFGINVRGVALCMKHEIPAMLKTGGGVIVNTASVLGIRPVPGLSIYNASKFAVIGLTKTAALEFAKQGIRINAVCPAIIETEMTAGLKNDPAREEHMRSAHPIGRFGKPEEIAASVLYLSSPTSGFVTGVSLPVDGGYTA